MQPLDREVLVLHLTHRPASVHDPFHPIRENVSSYHPSCLSHDRRGVHYSSGSLSGSWLAQMQATNTQDAEDIHAPLPLAGSDPQSGLNAPRGTRSTSTY